MAIPYQEFAKVHANAFFAIQWTGATLAFILLIFRLVVHWRIFRKLTLDDVFVGFAFTCYVASCAFWHINLPKTYNTYAAMAGKIPATRTVIREVASLQRSLVVFNVLFVCCLWASKFAFLTFFWQFRQVSQRRNYWWWIIALITLGTLIVSIGNYVWGCAIGSDAHIVGYCSSPKAKKALAATFWSNTTLDILTDCLILSIPISMAWSLHLPLPKKVMLYGLFSLTIFTMITALIRCLITPKGMIGADLTWTLTWSNIEMSTSIIIVCLGAFRQLYTARARIVKVSSDNHQASSLGKMRSSLGPRQRRIEHVPDTSGSQKYLCDVESVMPGAANEDYPVVLQTIDMNGGSHVAGTSRHQDIEGKIAPLRNAIALA